MHTEHSPTLIPGDADQRLASVIEMMRELSSQTDPQLMQEAYVKRIRKMVPVDGYVSLSRRNLERPRVRVTRSHLWSHTNPWKSKQHTILEGGLLGELIWNETPLVIDDLKLDPADPAAQYLEGMHSLTALPLFDEGKGLNMVVQLRRETNGFSHEDLPERLWIGNLFGRAMHNLVLSEQLKDALSAMDREMKVVGDMQRSLLPSVLPEIPGMELATHYQTSRRAGGDYYDFFKLPDGKWGILIADVSGHGTPAAVMMAITHSIAHTHSDPTTPPSKLLKFINCHLNDRYTNENGTFVTAFYGIYDPKLRELHYACAGHCPPRLKSAKDGCVISLDQSLSLPLGIDPQEAYHDITHTLSTGDALVLYTDGITEARKPDSADLFGIDRLDDVLNKCECDAEILVRNTMLAVEAFTDSAAPSDDMTVLVAKIL